jgi:hypothetical protein
MNLHSKFNHLRDEKSGNLVHGVQNLCPQTQDSSNEENEHGIGLYFRECNNTNTGKDLLAVQQNENLFTIKSSKFGINKVQSKMSLLPLDLEDNKENFLAQPVDSDTPFITVRHDERFITSRTSFQELHNASSKSFNSLSEPPLVSRQRSKDIVIDLEDIEVEPYEAEDEIYTEKVFSKTRHNRVEDILKAVDQGFDVNTRDKHGNTLLHVCAQNNHVKLASQLFQRCPAMSMSIRNRKLLTPLDYANKYNFARMQQWLLGRGAQRGVPVNQLRCRFR